MNLNAQLARIRFSTMGCPAELCVYADSRASALNAYRLAYGEAQRLDHKYSHYRADSYLARLQVEASQRGGAMVDAETAALLDFAGCLYQQSEGRFDVTAGPLIRLWQDSAGIPIGADINRTLHHTGWNKVHWNGSRLQLRDRMQLDLGGIVKEYAADRVALLLRRAGFRAGYIDLGGDLHILGPHPDGRPWKVGVRHPRPANSPGGPLAGIDIAAGSIASSGDYERYRMIGGERFSHIIDATTGWPVRGLASVSVLAPSCLLAGAASTLAMLLAPNAALHFLRECGLRWLAYQEERPHEVAFHSCTGFLAG